MWLTGRLMPDFKTIANFRKDNGPAIRGVCCALPSAQPVLAGGGRGGWQQVHGGEQSGSELHQRQGAAAPGADRSQHQSLHVCTR
jgi:hypothetical protein